MSLHAEMPSSKAKREQALRNILAARRRQILNQRSHDSHRIFLARTPQPGDTTTKGLPEIFDAQETRHNVYVTSARMEASMEEETSQSSIEAIERTISTSDLDSMELQTESQIPQKDQAPSSTDSHENVSSLPPSNAPMTSASSFTIGQKSGDADARKKNTVSMPESLYKHFRPVESNIPVEDMSQFLYFGQKLQPDAQNVTNGNSNNNSVEMTPSAPISRRGYSTKRLSATVAAPTEDMVNEEMNIALERRTVEKNQVSRIKNTYRNPGSGLYYRKIRPADVASNVILGNESSPVVGVSDTRSEIDTAEDKFRDDSSARANQPRERGSGVVTHVIEMSATSQISQQRQRQLDTDDDDVEGSIAEGSEHDVRFTNETTDGSRVVTTSPRTTTTTTTSDLETRVAELEIDQTDVEVMVSMSPRSRVGTSSMIRDDDETSSSSSPLALRAESPASTLRIVVPDESFGRNFAIESERTHRGTVKQPVDPAAERPVRVSAGGDLAPKSPSTTPSSSSSSSSSSSAPAVVVDSSQRQQQQQHVYAYTITNVTRLLRNYTGSGLNDEDRGRSGAGRRSSGVEITSDGPSQQQRQSPPPSSPLLLPRAGDGIEPARARARLSAGATVEPAAAAGASPSAVVGLVGELPRKVISQQQQQQQRAISQRTTWLLHSGANDSAVSPTKSVEVTDRGSIRWNHAKSRTNDQEDANDRRYLRKSASAVLNQRSNINEEASSALVASKRRRILLASQNATSLSTNGRRVKSDDRERIESKSTRVLADGRSNGTVASREEDSDDEAPGASLLEVVRASGVNQVPDDSSPSETTTVTANTTTIAIMASSSRNWSDESMDATDSSVHIDATTMTDKLGVPAEDVVTMTSSVNDARTGNDAGNDRIVIATPIESDANATVDEIATTVTERVGETTATPVFPVTPKILSDADRTTTEETFAPRPNVTKMPQTSKRPFGIHAVDLDPSEIQKRYRAKETTTTTTTVPANDAYSGNDADLPSSGKPETFDASTVAMPRNATKRTSSERSPEVRARNLSDKSKNKDEDVLPIMHLYNTSDIFNGSGPIDGSVRSKERPRVVFPMDPAAPDETNSPTTVGTPESTTVAGTTKVDGGASATVPVPRPKESTAAPTNSRKDKHEENRDSHDTVSASKGAPSFAPTANRTRYRPVYHHSILPEYNSTMYPVGLDRTFLEIGPISVSPRESINISEVISKRHDGDVIATQETVAVVSYILATLVVFPIAVGVGLILRRLILRNRKVLEESDTSSEISCRKDALNLENGDFKMSIEKAITKLPRIQHLCHEAEKPPSPPTQESRWEFPRDKLRLQTVLGQGNFGQVWKAEADDLTGHQGTTRLVAVKTVKEGASEREKEDLVRELEIMQQLGSHPNVVTLLGCCTEEEPHYLILEYVMYGKLLAYLRDHRTRQYFYNFSEDSAALTSRDLTVFGYCVARGMEYLASKKIIHRDLAARNVLVDHNKLCKIADFGMSRFANEDGEVIETRHGRNALPIRWMAPESLIYSLFTTKTDVWSFGILMWEIVTLGSTPYPDMTAREVMRNVHNGYRLERPSHCRSELFRVISRCWHADPDRRPEFQTLRRDLAQLLEDNMNGHYVDLESFASECTD